MNTAAPNAIPPWMQQQPQAAPAQQLAADPRQVGAQPNAAAIPQPQAPPAPPPAAPPPWHQPAQLDPNQQAFMAALHTGGGFQQAPQQAPLMAAPPGSGPPDPKGAGIRKPMNPNPSMGNPAPGPGAAPQAVQPNPYVAQVAQAARQPPGTGGPMVNPNQRPPGM